MDFLDLIFGSGEAADLSALQMAARALIIYLVTLAIVRLGKKRFMGRATAFDVIVGIMLGSIVSRAITGNAPMIPAMSAAAMVMALHWTFSALAVHWGGFGRLIKGRSRRLVQDGRPDEEALRAVHMTRHDLVESLRERGVGDLGQVAEARLERDGSVSVIRKTAEPRVLAVDVASGVQTVRIRIG
jgi:uncharacterized membrane protein YcaP (DUF421 family)